VAEMRHDVQKLTIPSNSNSQISTWAECTATQNVQRTKDVATCPIVGRKKYGAIGRLYPLNMGSARLGTTKNKQQRASPCETVRPVWSGVSQVGDQLSSLCTLCNKAGPCDFPHAQVRDVAGFLSRCKRQIKIVERQALRGNERTGAEATCTRSDKDGSWCLPEDERRCRCVIRCPAIKLHYKHIYVRPRHHRLAG